MNKKLNLKSAIISAILALAIMGSLCSCAQNQTQARDEKIAELSTTQQQQISTQDPDPTATASDRMQEPTQPPATEATEQLPTTGTQSDKQESTAPTLPPQSTPTTPSQTKPTTSNGSTHTHTFESYEINSFNVSKEYKEFFSFCKCGYKDVRRISSLDYNFTDPVTGKHICAFYTEIVSATCLKPQYQLTLCTGCDYRSEYQWGSSALANHDYSDWTVTKPATATEQGERTRTCTVCKKTNTEVIPVTSESRDYYIDPRLEINYREGFTSYRIDALHLGLNDARTWGDPPSIYIVDDSYLSITYYKQTGEKVQFWVVQIPDRYSLAIIREDGTYQPFSIGDFSD